MKTEKEIKERINKIEGYLSLSKEFGKNISNESNKLNKELNVLKWVLEEIPDKEGKINTSFNEDKILEFLRTQKEPKSYSQINYELNIINPNSYLSSLTKKGKIKREGSPRKYLYSIK